MTTQAPTGTLAESGVDSGLAKAKAMFLLAAGLSLLISVFFYFSGDPERGIFVGIWVPSILSAGTLLLGGARRD